MKTAKKYVDLDAILYNYRHLKCVYHKKIIAVLKDNAYGCGLIPIAQSLKNEDGIIFAVKNFQEGIKLRKHQIENPILILGVWEKKDLKVAKKHHFSVILSNIEQLSFLENSDVAFHIKLNASMNRLGLSQQDFVFAYQKTYQNENFCLEGLMSHFATADENHQQYNYFIDTLNKINYDKNLIVHCLSSNSIFEENDTNYARIGMKLYGFLERSAMFKDAVSLYSPIVKIIPVKKGEKVGYDFLFTAPSDGYVYILPLGYQNGWGRFKESYAYFNYLYLQQAGNQSMDFSAYFSEKKIKKESILELISLNVPLEHLAYLNQLSLYQIFIQLRDIPTIYDISHDEES